MPDVMEAFAMLSRVKIAALTPLFPKGVNLQVCVIKWHPFNSLQNQKRSSWKIQDSVL